jgi:hypothetical protein
MTFDMDFLLPGSRKMSYPYIEFNLSGTYLMFHLKINHGLANIVVINMF